VTGGDAFDIWSKGQATRHRWRGAAEAVFYYIDALNFSGSTPGERVARAAFPQAQKEHRMFEVIGNRTG